MAACDADGCGLELVPGGGWFHRKGEEHDLCRKHTGELGIAERERYVEVLTLDCLGEDRALYEDEEIEVSTTNRNLVLVDFAATGADTPS